MITGEKFLIRPLSPLLQTKGFSSSIWIKAVSFGKTISLLKILILPITSVVPIFRWILWLFFSELLFERRKKLQSILSEIKRESFSARILPLCISFASTPFMFKAQRFPASRVVT